jgi:hypothetical protein
MTPELYREAHEARIGADRMAMGLSCIPDPVRGDMVEVERLTAEKLELAKHIDGSVRVAAGALNEVERLKAQNGEFELQFQLKVKELERLELEVASWKQASDLKATEIERLTAHNTEAAAFLDGLAETLDDMIGQGRRTPAGDNCRAMATKLRGDK